MTIQSSSPKMVEIDPEHNMLARPRKGCMARLIAVPSAVWRFIVGVACCQHPMLAVLVVGWTYRLMQQHVLKQWWKASDRRADTTFAEVLLSIPETQLDGYGPNWMLHQSFRKALGDVWKRPTPFDKKMRLTLSCLAGSLWQNAKFGVQAMMNTWALTLPGCSLWLFAWFAGWNNSFHKGYELAWVGPATGLIGVGLFITAMLYVPMAQARQAATGSWRSFYDVALVATLIRQCWRASVILAGLYALLALPVMTLITLPTFFEQIWPELIALSDTETVEVLKQYAFRVGALGFIVFVGLKLAAARIYAAGVVRVVRSGAVGIDELGAHEQDALTTLGIVPSTIEPQRSARGRLGLGSRLASGIAVSLVVILWFSFVAQIFVAAFLNYRPIVGWLNHPLVHLPWFVYIPAGLS